MLPVVRDMHAASGLTEQVRASTVTLGEAEERLLDYVTAHVPEPRLAPLCGNSIATDRGFLARDMPSLDAHLHYRMIDVSSIKELAQALVSRGCTNPSRRRAWRTARSPTSGRASTSSQYYRRHPVRAAARADARSRREAAAEALLGASDAAGRLTAAPADASRARTWWV